MLIKIIASVALVIFILFAAVVSNNIVPHWLFVAKPLSAESSSPSCEAFGQPWPNWKWANVPWLSPPCDKAKGEAKDKSRKSESPAGR